MKRSKPMARSRMKRKPARRIAERMVDQPFRDWLHAQECVALEGLPEVDHWCSGRIEQSHGPAMGMGLKAPEAESWPACTGLHREWEEHRGVFKGWSKLARREFSKAMAEATQARWVAYCFSQQPSGTSGRRESATPGLQLNAWGVLKHPPAAETIYYCPWCCELDAGQPCRQCSHETVLWSKRTAPNDSEPPF